VSGVVVHACILGRLKFKTSLGQKKKRYLISINKLSMVVQNCNPSYVRGIDRRVEIPRPVLGKIMRSYLKNN
jgi:hypothetical protein